MNDRPQKKGGPRAAARLGAVQALYQLDMEADARAELTISDYIKHYLGQELEGDQYNKADEELFADIVKGTIARQEAIDAIITPNLKKDWAFDRLEKLIRAMLRAGSYELMARPDVPTAVVINEYVDIAHAFYDRSEANFINGILDKLAKEIRS